MMPIPRWLKLPKPCAPRSCSRPGVSPLPEISHQLSGSHDVRRRLSRTRVGPVENLIGEENKGWTYAKFLPGNKRTSAASIGRSTRYQLFVERSRLLLLDAARSSQPPQFQSASPDGRAR